MDIHIHIEKKHMYIIVAAILLVAGTGFVMAGFNPAFPWHPLQQITGDGGTTSVDENDDGIIDKAENLTCTDCRLSGNLSVADMLGIGITNPNKKLTVVGDVNITGDTYIAGILYGGSPVKVAGGLQLISSPDVPFSCDAAKKGSMYFNSGNNKHFICDGSSWNDYTGPKGDKGDTGATGSQGPKGDKGDTGATFLNLFQHLADLPHPAFGPATFDDLVTIMVYLPDNMDSIKYTFYADWGMGVPELRLKIDGTTGPAVVIDHDGIYTATVSVSTLSGRKKFTIQGKFWSGHWWSSITDGVIYLL